MDKIDRNTDFESIEAINAVLIKRLLDKSDELVEEGNKLKRRLDEEEEDEEVRLARIKTDDDR